MLHVPGDYFIFLTLPVVLLQFKNTANAHIVLPNSFEVSTFIPQKYSSDQVKAQSMRAIVPEHLTEYKPAIHIQSLEKIAERLFLISCGQS